MRQLSSISPYVQERGQTATVFTLNITLYTIVNWIIKLSLGVLSVKLGLFPMCSYKGTFLSTPLSLDAPYSWIVSPCVATHSPQSLLVLIKLSCSSGIWGTVFRVFLRY